MATETAYKPVTADMESPFLPWLVGRIIYSVGDSFDAEGIAVCFIGYDGVNPYAGAEMTDPVNEDRGIMAFPTLERAVRVALSPGVRIAAPRYLEVTYDEADVLGPPGPFGALSLAHVTVFAEVTP